jgi:AcrR family transcriptional regulator
MSLPESMLGQNLVYSSPKIFERRRRILQTSRELIAKHGYDGFSIRDLCQQANVASHTVYKAFESKERLVALSIRLYFQQFIESQQFLNDKTQLDGVLERVIISDEHMRDSREFVIAIAAIYFSQTAANDLQIAARMNIHTTLEPWAFALRERGHLRVGMAPQPFIDGVVALMFNASLEWCRGNIDSEEFLFVKLRALLTFASGATRGAGRREIDLRLNTLLARRELASSIRVCSIRTEARPLDTDPVTVSVD